MEIKFRAWDKKYHKMIFTGFHLLGEVMAFGQIEDYLFETKKIDGISTIERWEDIEVMLYTGKRDMNGVDIYRCDILDTDIPGWYKFRIDWDDDICGFIMIDVNDCKHRRNLCDSELTSMKVVDNTLNMEVCK